MNALKTWQKHDGYVIPTVVAVVLHVLVIAVFAIRWAEPDLRKAEPVPQHIIANVVQEENRAVVQRREEQARQQAAAERARQQRLAEQRRRAEQARQEKARQEQARQQAQRRQEAEKERQQQLQRQQEQQRAEQQAEQRRREQALQQQQQADQQRALERAAAEQQRLERLAEEREAAQQAAREAAAKRAAEIESITATHSDQIRAKIMSAWHFPPGVRREQEVGVRIRLVPTGEVIDVTITSSSGHAALDRSVEQAIRRASPLPVPSDLQAFEQNFRVISMAFRPENAAW
ncbi:MAG: TonB C-terminal domain-containing protein [Bacterioplanes sp.]|nr:TonB C-terminal domain-containing protein [Bacterioplanes sp.]